MLKRLGIDPAIFKNGIQATRIAYINRNDRGFVRKVLVKKTDIEDIKIMINDLRREVHRYRGGNQKAKKKLKKVLVEILETLAGEAPKENESISRFLYKKTGIPIQTKLLKISIEKLVDNLDEKEKRKKLVKILAKKIVKLDEVLGEEDREIKGFKENTGTYKTKKTGKVIRYFYNLEVPLEKRGNASDVLSAWVPLSVFP